MATFVRNVVGSFRLYRPCISNCFCGTFPQLHLKAPLNLSCNGKALLYRNYASLSFPYNGKVEFEHRRRTFNQKNFDEEPFQEDTEALKNLSRRHRDVAASEHCVNDGKSFSEFSLHPYLLEALNNLGYKTPFEIQSKTLEHTLQGRDVIGQAVTGSGKTLAFAIPIVHKIRQSRIDANERPDKYPRAIVVAPTRELCNQIYRSIQELDPKVRCVALYGGDSYLRQNSELARGVDVVCATPGRLNDHLEKKSIHLGKVQFLCLDEADELLNPNFKDQIEGLFSNSPHSKQVLMFSATMPDEVKELATKYMEDPEIVFVGSQHTNAPQNIEHQCIKAPFNTHATLVAKTISDVNAERCIVFLKTKAYCGTFANNLKRFGLKVDALHSDMSQTRRERILSKFRMGEIKVLCATDVAARGLDVPEVDVVFQVEPPANGVDFYIHRAGRTGRAGRKGLAILIHTGTFEEKKIINQIAQKVKLNYKGIQDDILDSMKEKNLNNALKTMYTLKLTEQDKALVTPIAEKLLSTENPVTLLSKVLMMISKVPVTNFNDDSVLEYSSESQDTNRYSSARYNNDGYRGRRSYNRNDRNNEYGNFETSRSKRSIYEDFD